MVRKYACHCPTGSFYEIHNQEPTYEYCFGCEKYAECEKCQIEVMSWVEA